MGYDLYIRAADRVAQPESDRDGDMQDRLLHHLGARPDRNGPGRDARFVVERSFGKMAVLQAPGPTSGLDCTLPEGLSDEDAREFVELILAAATAEDQVVFDPQAGRTVTQADLEVVLAEWRRFNRYRLQTVGSEPSDLLAGGAIYPEYDSPTRPSTIFWLTVGLLFVLGLILVRFCT